MDRINRIANCERTARALCSFDERQEEIISWIVAVQQIPAPTFGEAARARFVQEQFSQLGLSDVRQDRLHNVYGRYPGKQPRSRKPVIVSAHSDTVFPPETDLRLRRDEDHIYGPGVGDNSAGVAGLFAIADALRRFDLQPCADVWFVSNVGEEGLGDLRGMRAVVEHFGRQAIYIVVEGGLFGQIAHEATGVRRFRIEVTADGGHSWGSFGSPNAIHIAAEMVTAIYRLGVSEKPKTTYNVGVMEGGTTVNSIAAEASFLLDLRSESEEELQKLVVRIMDIVRRARTRAAGRGERVSITVEQVGNRPAGRIPRDAPLVTWAEQALRRCGRDSILFVSGSTDANIPLSLSIPSVCVGLTESSNSHRLDEQIATRYLSAGLQQLLLLILAASDYRG